MKTIFLLLLVLGSSYMPAQTPQNDPKATEILNGVSAKYKSLKAVQADFTVRVENGANTSKDVQSGTLYVNGNKYKIQLKNQEIICDNTTVWTYLKDANEVQVNNYDPDENTITPSQIFTIYEKDFLYAYIEEKKLSGKLIQIIELTPHDKSKPYFKIRLGIDKIAKAVQSAVVFDKNGNRYTYEIKKFTPDPDIADSLFTFDNKQHPGIEVVDLR
ncbi:MAG: outer membrane lipoprotein carrier protein LolA [Chitinophagales bacterium]